MKRYWKIIFLCFLSIIVIGAFYIQSSFANQNQIQIQFEKVKGDENEVKDLLLYGEYTVGNLYQGLQITSEETIQPNQKSFLYQLTPARYAPLIRNLIKEHKSFMRGKDFSPSHYYEDENILAYAAVKGNFNDTSSHSTFDIEVLNKKTEETITIESDVPGMEKYSWMHVADVQVIKNTLKVFTRGFGKEGDEALFVYTFNLKTKKLVSDDTITASHANENSWVEARLLTDDNSIQPQDYHLMMVNTFEAENVEKYSDGMSYDGVEKLVKQEVYIYNIQQNQLEKLTFPEEGLESDAYSIFQSSIYVHDLTADGLNVHVYDIKKAEWTAKWTFDLPEDTDGKSRPYIEIMDGKLYTLYATGHDHTLLIGDLETGGILYEGKLKVQNQEKDSEEYQLYFHDIE
ncbi:hypothetical protein [Bacillus tuaregi]|uniref:hypothetical protein n=1 Tax=Bacillus tuaregi TaxID=1816695 RepID=UPI0008F8F71F|nr:hypothetical protein [Bacillus tuaregi]